MVDNFMTIYASLPYKVGGFTMYNSCDDYYTIVLNSKLSHSQNKSTFEHELKHITNCDFTGIKDVGLLETRMH